MASKRPKKGENAFFGISASRAGTATRHRSPVTVVTQLSPSPSPTTTTTDASVCCRQTVRMFFFLLFVVTDEYLVLIG